MRLIMFRPLTKDEIQKVVELQLGIIQRMLEKNGIRLKSNKESNPVHRHAGL